MYKKTGRGLPLPVTEPYSDFVIRQHIHQFDRGGYLHGRDGSKHCYRYQDHRLRTRFDHDPWRMGLQPFRNES